MLIHEGERLNRSCKRHYIVDISYIFLAKLWVNRNISNRNNLSVSYSNFTIVEVCLS